MSAKEAVLTDRVRIPPALLVQPDEIAYFEAGEIVWILEPVGVGLVRILTLAGELCVPKNKVKEQPWR